MVFNSKNQSNKTPDDRPCFDDPIEELRRLFVDVFQAKGTERGRNPATRPVFLRLHGVAHGQLNVLPDLSKDLRIGVFGQKHSYPVYVRFSSDVQPGIPDLGGTIGVALKLFDVDGAKLLAQEETASTHDFIFQNHDVFFVDTAADMCEFTSLSLSGRANQYLEAHPRTKQILDEMRKRVQSVFGATYWSVLPSRYGDRFVKTKLEPVAPPTDNVIDEADPFYLKADLTRRLKERSVVFRMSVQFQKDESSFPIDRATERWSEVESPYIPIAELVLPVQDVDTRGQNEYGENLAFNPWHCLPEHEPMGSLSAARRIVYQSSANDRRNVNAIPVAEPEEPRPPTWKADKEYPMPVDTTIVRAAIHPAIGVGRVGSSDAWFIGPEICHAPPPTEGYRDTSGHLKREAARFRIYGYNSAGELVGELTSDTADIRWNVHVANEKAAWYKWQIALDVKEGEAARVQRRNPTIKGADRKVLSIDAGMESIRGKSQPSVICAGAFKKETVQLAELQTDESGRLIVIPGKGVSNSPSGNKVFDRAIEDPFANADDWYDDICDGPVDAVVSIAGRVIPVEGAWVLTAPPNYAPGVEGNRTLYDLLVDLYIQNKWLEPVKDISFTNDVYPMLRRLTRLGWVNAGYVFQYGPGSPYPFEDQQYVDRLRTTGSINDELRRIIFNSFRRPEPVEGNQMPWPWLYGDGMSARPADETNPNQNAHLSAEQHRILGEWAGGRFIDDWDDESGRKLPTSIDEVELVERPAMLDRAALDHCLADAFHPGCEVTWPIRHLSMFLKPFRIKRRDPNEPEPDYGERLTPELALGQNGPLHGQQPGGLTRWMGLPWQADTAYCRSGYDRAYDPFVPTFWPARVPNYVLLEADYQQAVDKNLSTEERLQAFVRRYYWNTPVDEAAGGPGNVNEVMLEMVRVFGSMAHLQKKDGILADPILPSEMLVATFGPDFSVSRPEALPVEMKAADAEAVTSVPSWDDPEVRASVPVPVTIPRSPKE